MTGLRRFNSSTARVSLAQESNDMGEHTIDSSHRPLSAGLLVSAEHALPPLADAGSALVQARSECDQLRAEVLAAQAEIEHLRHAQTALQGVEDRYRALFETSPDAIAVFDLEMRLVMSNLAGAVLHGYSTAEELIGKYDRDFIAEEDLPRLAEHAPDLWTTGKLGPIEYHAMRKDGSRFLAEMRISTVFNEKREPAVFVGVARDITERNRAETALREVYEFNKQIIASLGEGLAVHDTDLRYVIWNPFMEKMSGRQAAEVIGEHPLKLFPFLKDWGVYGLLERALAGETLTSEDKLTPLPTHSTPRWTMTRAEPYRDRTGRVAGVISTVTDITVRKQAEEEVRQLNVTLENRVTERTRELQAVNSELEAFVYSVSHDLRSPLLTMHGFAQALLEDCGEELGATGRDYAQRIVNAARTLDRLLGELLQYSRLSQTELEPEPVDLEWVVRETLIALSAEIRARNAEVTIDGPLPKVLGHMATLLQVVSNLVGNAVKFVAPGVTPRVRIWAESLGTSERLWIEDNGIGIPREHRDRIFRVFERLHTSDAYPGTGVGLAVVRKGVERMHGVVGLRSEPGAGSQFWIELPGAGGQA